MQWSANLDFESPSMQYAAAQKKRCVSTEYRIPPNEKIEKNPYDQT